MSTPKLTEVFQLGDPLFFGRPKPGKSDMRWDQFQEANPEVAASFQRWATDVFNDITGGDPNHPRAKDLEELVELQKHWIFRPMRGGVIEANPNVVLEDVPPIYYDPIADTWVDSSTAGEKELANIDRLMGRKAVFGYSDEPEPDPEPGEMN